MLRIDKVSKIIKEKKILNAITLHVDRGSIAFLIGESGVGKSTLLRILNRLDTYDQGSINLDGVQLESLNVHQQIGMIFQHFNLFTHLSVIRNVTIALEKVYNKTPEQANNVAMELLNKYKLSDKAYASVTSLSGGQKQRLAIVRALALNPSVICFDEPTSALDPLLTNYVAQQIQKLADEKRVIIVATHDINVVLNPYIEGTVYLMHGGSIIACATTQEIKQKKTQSPAIELFLQGVLLEQ